MKNVMFSGFSRYNSWGAKIRGGNCTIYGENFDSCNHLEDKIYFGRLYKRSNFKIMK